jgi:hypothetical protein
VIEAAFSVLQPNDTYIIKTKDICNELNKNFYFDKIEYTAFKFVTGVILDSNHPNQCSLLFINIASETFFYVNPSNENDEYKLWFYDKWR